MIRKFLGPKLFVGACVLVASVVGGSLAAHKSSAAYTVCRTDPKVTLSNGTVVSMEVDVYADVSQIRSVKYIVHVPQRLTTVSVSYDGYGYLETVAVIADERGTTYITDTLVNTKSPARVTAISSISGLGTQSQSGNSGQHLVSEFGHYYGNSDD
jgi:hypothetical protein